MKTKYKTITFHLFELDALATYFEAMAAKGWMLQRINLGRMCFTKCEPQATHFYLTINALGSILSPDYIRDEQSAYVDFIEDFGYESVCVYSSYQVFKSSQKDIIPIENYKQELHHRGKRKTILKHELYNYFLLAIMYSVFSVLFFSTISIHTFTSNASLCLPFLYAMLGFLFWWCSFPAIKWLILKDKYHITWQRLLLRERYINIYYISLAVLFLSLLFFDFMGNTLFVVLLSFLAFLISYFLLEFILSHFVKKYATILASIFSALITMSVFTQLTLSQLMQSDAHTTFSSDETVVSIQQLKPDLPKPISTDTYRSASIVLEEVNHYEDFNIPFALGESRSYTTSYSYTLYTIRPSFLQAYLMDLILHQRNDNLTLEAQENGWTWYRARHSDFLVKDDHILILDDEFSIEQEQIDSLLKAFDL